MQLYNSDKGTVFLKNRFLFTFLKTLTVIFSNDGDLFGATATLFSFDSEETNSLNIVSNRYKKRKYYINR